MDKIKLEVTDEVSVRDVKNTLTPRGHIIIKDSDGNVLVDKDNMVVLGGREFIYYLFMDKLDSSDKFSDTEKEALTTALNNPVKYICLTNSTAETKLDFNSENETGVTRYYFGGGSGITTSGDNATKPLTDFMTVGRETLTSIPYITFSTEVSSAALSGMNQVSAIEIQFANGAIFSRARFDVIPVMPGVDFSIEYYLYF